MKWLCVETFFLNRMLYFYFGSYFGSYPWLILNTLLRRVFLQHCFNMSTFHVIIDGARATALYYPQSSTSSLSANFCSLHRYRSRNGKVRLGVSVDTLVDPFFCLLDCTVFNDLSPNPCDIVLGCDWFTYVSLTFPNAIIRLSETEYLDFSLSPQMGIHIIEQGMSSLPFHGEKFKSF